MPPVDRKTLIAALDEQNPGKMYFIDRVTAKILTVTIEDKAGLENLKKMLAKEPQRYTQVPKPDPATNRTEVEQFIAQVKDPKFKEVLKRAMQSHAPFREFRDALHTKVMEKREWDAFHKKTLEQKAERFLKSAGLT